MGDFHEYHSGKLRAPVPTLFIGGNHEASNYLRELYHGGWVCPNIFFMGYSGVVQFGGLRIGGISGIHNEAHYDLGYYERFPFQGPHMRSIYHYRNFELFKLMQIKEPLDIFISHEWPTGIYHYGDIQRLLRIKPFFKKEVSDNSLGAKPLEQLLFKLKPTHWFSAHLHVDFHATVPHPGAPGEKSKETSFMALDKCLPKRTFLQIIDIPTRESGNLVLKYDPEWLKIVKAADPLMNFTKSKTQFPSSLIIEQDMTLNDLTVPIIFTPTKFKAPSNPQTDAFCNFLNVPNRFSSAELQKVDASNLQSSSTEIEENPDEIKLDI